MLLSATVVLVDLLLVSLTVWPPSTSPLGDMVFVTVMEFSSRKLLTDTKSRFQTTGSISTLGSSLVTM